MAKRGRKSASQLTVGVQQFQESPTMVQRPDAPYDLTDTETDVWWTTVNAMPADWFPAETHALLKQYCRHVVTAAHIALLIQDFTKPKRGKEFDAHQYDKLCKMQEREGRAITSLARSMRLTQHSRVRSDAASVKESFDQVPDDYEWPINSK